jgi:hypothetical protein
MITRTGLDGIRLPRSFECPSSFALSQSKGERIGLRTGACGKGLRRSVEDAESEARDENTNPLPHDPPHVSRFQSFGAWPPTGIL